MNSYLTHNDVTALEFCCCGGEKQENSGRAGSNRGASFGTRLGIAERALNDPRNLTSTNSDTSKTT
jgi:hypothetical protein